LIETFATKDDFKQILEVMRISREESNRRFEAIERRFEQLQQEMDRRFEIVDKRFEEVNQRFEDMNQRFEEMDKRLEEQMAWVGTVIGGLQRRAGKNLEDTIAATLRFVLKRSDIKPENLQLRQKIIDEDGIIWSKRKKVWI
jgi:hypothetical protein